MKVVTKSTKVLHLNAEKCKQKVCKSATRLLNFNYKDKLCSTIKWIPDFDTLRHTETNLRLRIYLCLNSFCATKYLFSQTICTFCCYLCVNMSFFFSYHFSLPFCVCCTAKASSCMCYLCLNYRSFPFLNTDILRYEYLGMK